jgi:DNA/RNA-binding domain of Phe-tRNA-synthetase-like protein
MSELELTAAPGFVEPRVRAEFPGLALAWMTVEVRGRASPRWVKQRLHQLSNRWHGASVVAMRTQPIPHAYRSFFHQVGLDPEATRIPSEAAAVNRLLHGGFRSTGLLDDALLIALVETGVPVWALDADRVDAAGLGIRTSAEGERFGVLEQSLAGGRLVVADGQAIQALLFGPVAAGHEARGGTSHAALFSVGVPRVPAIHLEEALWTCGEILSAVRPGRGDGRSV